MTQTTDRTADEVHEVDLAITGMTCASCSARIERKLGKLEGVEAVVNLATEKATVRYSGAVTVQDLLQTVRKTGYVAGDPDRTCPEPADQRGRRVRPAERNLRSDHRRRRRPPGAARRGRPER